MSRCPSTPSIRPKNSKPTCGSLVGLGWIRLHLAGISWILKQFSLNLLKLPFRTSGPSFRSDSESTALLRFMPESTRLFVKVVNSKTLLRLMSESTRLYEKVAESTALFA